MTSALEDVNRGQRTGGGEFALHWRVLPPSIAGIFLSSAPGYTIGVMAPRIEQEFGWMRTQVTMGLLIIAAVALFAAPVVGAAVDRFGPRRIGLFGVIASCAALTLVSTTTQDVITWWGLWSLLAIAIVFVLPTVWTAEINARYHKNRGKALAFALCGTGLGAAIVPALTNSLADVYGWRGAYIGLGVIFFLLTFPLAWALFRPHKVGHGNSRDIEGKQNFTGVSAKEGFRSPRFIMLASAATLFTIAICALTVNAVPVLMSLGFPAGEASRVAGLIGIGSILGRLGGGFLLDKFGAGKVAAISVLLPIFSIAVFLGAPGNINAIFIACLVLGLAFGCELDATAYLVVRHFGLRSFGALFGAINGLLMFSSGFGPLLANLVYDSNKNYVLAFWGLVPIFACASLLFLFLGPYPRFEGEPQRELRDAPV